MEYIKAGAYHNPMMDSIDFYITRRPPGADQHFVGVITMTPIDDLAAMQPPGFRLTKHNAQKLMNDLWVLGIRPDEMSETEGALNSMKDHLADMRTLAFKMFESLISSNIQDRTIDE